MATIVTIQATDQITNSRVDINTNFSNLNTDKIETSVIDTDSTMAANSDAKIPSQKAVKTLVETGGNIPASTTAKGIVEEATAAEVAAGTAAGGTGARLFVNPSTLPPSTILGNGADGTATLDGSTDYSGWSSRSGDIYTMTRDAFLADLTINSGKTLKTAGYRLFVNGTLAGAGTISNNGNNGGNGANGSGTTGGTAGTAGAATTGYFTNAAGAAGVTGQSGSANASAGTNASAIANALVTNAGGAGGKGARSDSGAGTAPNGGSGGTATAARVTIGKLKVNTFSILDISSTGATVFYTPGPSGGSGGKGGAQSGGSSGGSGGGGASGGIVAIYARYWTGTFTIESKGGNGGDGGNGANNGGGSGGGGGGTGGFILVVYESKTWTGSYVVTAGSGGTKGTSSGSAPNDGTGGSAGGVGASLEVELKYVI